MKVGDKVLIIYSGQRCYGDIGDEPKEVTIIGYHTEFIDKDGSMRVGAYSSYNTFKDSNGEFISFSSEDNEDYIIKILESNYEIY